MSDRTLTEKDLAHWNGIATTALLSTIGDPSRAAKRPVLVSLNTRNCVSFGPNSVIAR